MHHSIVFASFAAVAAAQSQVARAANSAAYTNGFTSFLSQTQSDGVITGMPSTVKKSLPSAATSSPVTSQPAVVTSQPNAVVSAIPGIPSNSVTTSTKRTTTQSSPITTTKRSATSFATSFIRDTKSKSLASPTRSALSTSSPQHSTSSRTVGANAATSSATSNPTLENVAPHSSGLSSTAKLGIGLGVPFGVLVLAIIAFSVLRYRKYKVDSRLRHHGNKDAAGLYPATNEKLASSEVDNSGTPHAQDEGRGMTHDIHELHGQEVPLYSRELMGTPGVARQELSPRRGSV